MARRRIRSSRLSRYAEKQNKKQFILFGLGTIIVIFLLIQFAGPILNLFGNIVFGIRGDEQAQTSESPVNEILQPPDLIDIPNATASAEINVSGTSNYEEGEVLLYVNNQRNEELDLNGESNFEFENVSLRNGENLLKVKYVREENESDFSDEYTVVRASEEPEIEIESPADNETFTRADQRITVAGTADPNNTVTVNGSRAVVDNDGEYSYLLELSEGDNTITVEATNEAGVSTTEEITVTYREE